MFDNDLLIWLPIILAGGVLISGFAVFLVVLGLTGRQRIRVDPQAEIQRRKDLIRKVRGIEVRTRHIVNDVFAGNYHSAFKGQGMEFEEVREYMPGDDIRSIDWNVTARTTVPFIKKFKEEREICIWVLVDVSASNLFGSRQRLKKDIAAEIAAILAFAAIKNNDRVGLILFTDHVEHFVAPQKGVRHVLRIVSDVLNVKPTRKGSDPVPALDFMNKLSKRHAIVFMVSDFLFTGNFQRTIGLSARHHDMVGIVLGDRHEQAWPRVGLIEWEDPETGERHLRDTSDANTRRQFTRMQAVRRSELLEDLHRKGVDTIEISASEPYEKPFMKFFRMRAHRMAR